MATRNLRPSDPIIHRLISQRASRALRVGWVCSHRRATPSVSTSWLPLDSGRVMLARLGTGVFPLQPVTSSVGWSYHNKGRAQVPWRLVCPLCPWTHVLLFYIDIYFLNIHFSRDYNYLVNTVDFYQNSVQLEKILTVKWLKSQKCLLLKRNKTTWTKHKTAAAALHYNHKQGISQMAVVVFVKDSLSTFWSNPDPVSALHTLVPAQLAWKPNRADAKMVPGGTWWYLHKPTWANLAWAEEALAGGNIDKEPMSTRTQSHFKFRVPIGQSLMSLDSRGREGPRTCREPTQTKEEHATSPQKGHVLAFEVDSVYRRQPLPWALAPS